MAVSLEAFDEAPAQQALPPDAAVRRGCRRDFGTKKRTNVIPIYQCGAGEAQAVGPHSTRCIDSSRAIALEMMYLGDY